MKQTTFLALVTFLFLGATNCANNDTNAKNAPAQNENTTTTASTLGQNEQKEQNKQADQTSIDNASNQNDQNANNNTNQNDQSGTNSQNIVYAEQNIAGTSTIAYANQEIELNLKTTGNTKIINVHVWVGTLQANWTDYPVNRGGSPVLGKFPLKYSFQNGQNAFTLAMTPTVLNDLGIYDPNQDQCTQQAYLVVHVETQTMQADGTFATATHWVGNLQTYPAIDKNSVKPIVYLVLDLPCAK